MFAAGKMLPLDDDVRRCGLWRTIRTYTHAQSLHVIVNQTSNRTVASIALLTLRPETTLKIDSVEAVG